MEQQLRVSVFYVFQLKLSTYLYLVSLRINNLTFHVLELALFQISSVVDCKTYSKKTVVTMPTLYVSHSLVWFSNKCEVCLITINFYHLRKQTRCCPNENKNHVIMKTAYRFYMYIVLAFQSCYSICHSTRCKLRHCVLPVIKQAIHQRKMWLIKGKTSSRSEQSFSSLCVILYVHKAWLQTLKTSDRINVLSIRMSIYM